MKIGCSGYFAAPCAIVSMRPGGWDELLQRAESVTSLRASEFQILEIGATATGSYHLSEKQDHFLLNMMLVEPARQRKGYGSLMITRIQTLPRDRQKPLHLSVLKTSPAVRFYLARSLVAVNEDDHSLQMYWR